MFRVYFRLIKPGVMLGNLLTTAAGFLFAANGQIDWRLFLATNIGTGLIISSACVINNYLDQDIDSVMARTKSRPLVSGEISGARALVFGSVLGVLGLAILIAETNWWVVGAGIFGFVTYVWLYGALGKRRSVHGTLVGSLSGAAPIAAGYMAVSNQLDFTALVLFAILFFWQEPEFYSISIYRAREYAKAKVPVSSVVRGIPATIRQIFIYTLLATLFLLLLKLDERASWTYFVVMLLVSTRWIALSAKGFSTKNPESWAKKNFHFTLKVLLIFCFIISINSRLP